MPLFFSGIPAGFAAQISAKVAVAIRLDVLPCLTAVKRLDASSPTCCACRDAVKMLPHWTVITYLLYTSRYTCRQNAATLSLPTCCAHQDKHKSCCQNVATLDNHYLLVVHIKIHKIHAVKMLPHQTVITYLLCTLRYACCRNAVTSDSHCLLVVHIKIHMLSKGCHTGQSLPTCCAFCNTLAAAQAAHRCQDEHAASSGISCRSL